MEIDVSVAVADAFNNVVTVPPAIAGTNTGDVQVSGGKQHRSVCRDSDDRPKQSTPVSGFASYPDDALQGRCAHLIAGDDVTINRGLP